MRTVITAALLLLLTPLGSPAAGVVINEIFYNAPDDLDDLQWVELHNPAGQAVDLSGWSLDRGRVFEFQPGTKIEGGGYLVVALKPDVFRKHYNSEAVGPLKRQLKRGSERLELTTRAGERVDIARYRDRDPWPISADAYSASLERICPGASGEPAENWAASPLPTDAPKPSGTPGRQNTAYSASLPPVISLAGPTPEDIPLNQPLPVEVEVKGAEPPREVTLLYRIVSDGAEGAEAAVPMQRGAATGRYSAEIPGQKADAIIRYRVRAVSAAGATRISPGEHDLRPTFSVLAHGPWEPSKLSLARIIHVRAAGEARTSAAPARRRAPGPIFFPGFGRREQQPRPPRGAAALVYVDAESGKTRLFDHINIVAREADRGHKVFFHKDRTLKGMSSVSLVFEGTERFLLAEALSYDVYRRAGNAACLTEFVRVYLDGHPAGYHLLIERPNRSFLRRNGVDDGGSLYKLIWYGRGVAEQHEKKTHTQTGHKDLLAVVEQLRKSRGDEQWKVIEENFNVKQVATYFAVNTVLSHWDGFFNNHFVYHDTQATRKWEMYPWDQDKTWGYYDGLPEDRVFFDMPLTFGMEGDRPPGGGAGGRSGGGPFGGRGAMWWRPGGYFSAPLLANPQFRKIFLARTREILDTVYTEEIYFPLIQKTADLIRDDVELLAEINGEKPEDGVRRLERNVQSLRSHLQNRRQFLLDQPELKTVSGDAARR